MSLWRKRYADQGIAGLHNALKSGRPRSTGMGATYLQVLLRGAARAAADKAATTRIWAAEIGVEPQDVAASYRGDYHTTAWPLLDQAMRHRLRVQIDFLHRHGYLERDVDIDAWAQPQFLAEAYRREQGAPR